MNQELTFVLCLLASIPVTLGIYLLVTRSHRNATKLYNLLSNSVWQVNASLRTREWEANESSVSVARGFELMQELETLVQECNEHLDVAKAWLLAGRVGHATVELRCDLGLAAIGRFYRSLRHYDMALAE